MLICFICVYKIGILANAIKLWLLPLKVIKVINNYIVSWKLEIIPIPERLFCLWVIFPLLSGLWYFLAGDNILSIHLLDLWTRISVNFWSGYNNSSSVKRSWSYVASGIAKVRVIYFALVDDNIITTCFFKP